MILDTTGKVEHGWKFVCGPTENKSFCSQINFQHILSGQTDQSHIMRQSTTTTSCTKDSFFSDTLGVIIDGLCASTAMEVDRSYLQEDFDNETFSKGRTSVFRKRASSIYFDFAPSQQHFVAERDDESCSMRDETQANIELKSPQLSFSTEITANMTWASSFDDMDDDLLINEIQGVQQIFEPNDSQFHSHTFMQESTSNSIFRPKEDCDHERRERYANIVRMKQDNYEHDDPQALKLSLKVLTSTLNLRPKSPAQLKYPDEKAKEEVRRQFLREHAAEQQIYREAQKHNLVMGRAA